jgi:hypothetical protein
LISFTEKRPRYSARLAWIIGAVQLASTVGTTPRLHRGGEFFIDLQEDLPELGIVEIQVQHDAVSYVLVDTGDNLLGALFASSLRGLYPLPSHNLNKFPPISLR